MTDCDHLYVIKGKRAVCRICGHVARQIRPGLDGHAASPNQLQRELVSGPVPADSVQVRWFFVSNWGNLYVIPRVELEQWMRCQYDGFSDRFRETGYFEIIDGPNVWHVQAATLAEPVT